MSNPDSTFTDLHAALSAVDACQGSHWKRVQWLLTIADVLDHTGIDGAADLATTARQAALGIVSRCIANVAGLPEGRTAAES